MALLHFAPSQTNAINTQRQKRLEQDPKQSRSSRAYELLRSAWDLALRFGKRTTIHGVNRLLGETEGRYERAIWFLTVVLAFMGSIYVCLLLSRRFNEGKFQTVVDSTRLPVYKINFPVVTLCNFNRLNWARIGEAKKMFIPNEKSTQRLQLFEKIVASYDDVEFGKFDEFFALDGLPVEYFSNVNFSLVFDFMTWRCEEFFEKCIWRLAVLDCCEIFSKRRSKNGLCWSFNTLETEEGRQRQRSDPFWPWRTGGAGPKSALEVRVLINPEKHYPGRVNEKGLTVMITEPNVWHRQPMRVSADTEAMLEIEPVVYFYDNDTRSVSSDQRECVFEDETTSSDFKSLQNYIYMIENCQSECHQEHLMNYCNCSMDLLFPPGQYPPCKVKDLLCLAKNNDHFIYSHQPGEEKYVKNLKDGMECKCFRNCYSLNYVPDVRSTFLPVEVRKNVSYVDLDVHFRFDTLMVYRTSLVFGWIDLMVAFGGIAGLFLGCSLISAIELVYFAVIEIPNFLYKRFKCKRDPQPPLQDKNPIFMHRVNYHRFDGFIERNINQRGNQLEDFLFRNNTIRTTPRAPPYVSLQPGQLNTWERLNSLQKDKILSN